MTVFKCLIRSEKFEDCFFSFCSFTVVFVFEEIEMAKKRAMPGRVKVFFEIIVVPVAGGL